MRALAVTSPLPQEGKTTTTCNLAVALAQAGKRVLIIDADLRKPRLHKVFRVKNLNGLTKYLTADLALEDLVACHVDPVAVPDQFRSRAAQSPRAAGIGEDGEADRPTQG